MSRVRCCSDRERDLLRVRTSAARRKRCHLDDLERPALLQQLPPGGDNTYRDRAVSGGTEGLGAAGDHHRLSLMTRMLAGLGGRTRPLDREHSRSRSGEAEAVAAGLEQRGNRRRALEAEHRCESGPDCS